MARYVVPLEAAGLRPATHMGIGEAREVIVRVAQELNADFLVIGTHSKQSIIDVALVRPVRWCWSIGEDCRIRNVSKGYPKKVCWRDNMINERSYYLRNPNIVTVGTAASYLFIDINESVYEITTRHPACWSRLLQRLMVPTRGDTLLTQLLEPLEINHTGLESLLNRGFLIEATTPVELEIQRDRLFTDNQAYYLKRGEQKCGHLVVALTGSITAGLMAPVILSLCYSGFHGQIDLILTEAARRFVNHDFFEFYGIRTWINAFDRRDGLHVPHIALGQSADCLLVMPASAACCQRLADGTCSDLLSMTVAATTAPVVMAPVMNTTMWDNVAVQRNIQRIRDDGMYVIDPTLIFSAAELIEQGEPMYGGPGTFWLGPLGVMHTLSAVIEHHHRRR